MNMWFRAIDSLRARAASAPDVVVVLFTISTEGAMSVAQLILSWHAIHGQKLHYLVFHLIPFNCIYIEQNVFQQYSFIFGNMAMKHPVCHIHVYFYVFSAFT